MNYKKHYDALIGKSKNRKLEGYFEKHHIIPKCLDGNDEVNNIAILTAREHFIAHLLLTKIYPSNMKLVKAVAIMCIGQSERKLTNRLYGRIRELFSQAQSESQSGRKNSQYGTIWIYNPKTKEHKKIKNKFDIEENWVFGRYKKPKPPKPPTQSQIKKINLITQYNEYYKIYEKNGFKKFCEITEYKKSQANLVQIFKRYVKNFKPQNGKKRG